MDTDALISHARSRFDHAAAKKLLQEKYQARMIFAHGGGMWCAGPELLVLLTACNEPAVVLQDLYGTPVRVTVEELKDLAQQRWQEQMTAWLMEFENLQRQR